MITNTDLAVIGWIALCSVYAFVLFGWDKSKAGSAGSSRVSEMHLLMASAVGGWPGGLAGMLVFRHKTAKTSFKVKFILALFLLAGGLWAYWRVIRTGA
jgi:uncharacterized membrane protein YsdA (DUF1294 family)